MLDDISRLTILSSLSTFFLQGLLSLQRIFQCSSDYSPENNSHPLRMLQNLYSFSHRLIQHKPNSQKLSVIFFPQNVLEP